MEINTLKQIFAGRIIRPGDSGYKEFSNSFTHKGPPALIVFPQHNADVAAMAWGRTVTPFLPGAYVNYLSKASPEETAAAYLKAAYGRLARLKAKCDPKNVFSQTFNVIPA